MDNREYELEDIEYNGFLHSRIHEFTYDHENKLLKVNFDFAELKTGGALIDCTITITDWWDLEVTEKGEKIFNKYSHNEIPTDIDQIFRYEYDGNTLMLKACGHIDIDSVVNFKFTKPKIQITGEYDPD